MELLEKVLEEVLELWKDEGERHLIYLWQWYKQVEHI